MVHDSRDSWIELESKDRLERLYPDHLAAGRAALDARIAAKMLLYYPESRHDAGAIGEIWLFNAGAPNHYVDVSDTLELQYRALAEHRSQTTVWDETARRFIGRMATENGKQIGVKYAEAFRRITIEGASVVAEGTKLGGYVVRSLVGKVYGRGVAARSIKAFEIRAHRDLLTTVIYNKDPPIPINLLAFGNT